MTSTAPTLSSYGWQSSRYSQPGIAEVTDIAAHTAATA